MKKKEKKRLVGSLSGEYGDFEFYTLPDGTLEAIIIDAPKTLVVPPVYKGVAVSVVTPYEDGVGYSEYTELTECVVIPSGIKRISNHAFYSFSNLSSVTLGDTVEYIGQETFGGCDSLKEITLPRSINEIATLAFHNSDALTSINVEEGNEFFETIDGNLYTKGGGTLIKYAEGKREEFFVLPDTTYEIRSDALIGKSPKPKLQASPKNPHILIEDGAFYSKDGTRLIKYAPIEKTDVVTVREGCTEICERAFSHSDVKEVRLPESLIRIAKHAFENSVELEKINFPRGLREIEFGAFWDCKSLREINFPEDFVGLSDYAFSGCSSVSSLKIPEGIARLPNSAFAGMVSLTELYIPSGVTHIGNSTFMRCGRLKKVTLPEGLKVIDDFAFCYCFALEEINIPTSVKKIGANAFDYCKSLVTLYIPKSVTEIGAFCFSDTEKLMLLAEAEKAPDGWNSSFKEYKTPIKWGACKDK